MLAHSVTKVKSWWQECWLKWRPLVAGLILSFLSRGCLNTIPFYCLLEHRNEPDNSPSALPPPPPPQLQSSYSFKYSRISRQHRSFQSPASLHTHTQETVKLCHQHLWMFNHHISEHTLCCCLSVKSSYQWTYFMLLSFFSPTFLVPW